MTIKLYEENPYLKECKSKIINVIKEEDNILLILDKTIFFPEGGGQPCDIGYIGDSKVLYVYEKNDVIYHKVDIAPTSNEEICQLDWDRRFDHMQQHCGEHILSGVFLSSYNIHNKGFHLGEDYITIDMDSKRITDEMIQDVETKANKAITDNMDITINTVETKELASKYPLRKMPDITINIRIVHIKEVDCVACCGTHPSKTGDVGLIKILRAQSYKGMTRIFFKCGMRALKDFQKQHEIITYLNKKYSSDINNVQEKIKNEEDKINIMRKELKNIKNQLCDKEVEKLINKEVDFIYNCYEDRTMEDIQYISNKIVKEKNNCILLLCSLYENKIMIINNRDNNVDCGKIFKEHIANYNGRGGGNAKKAQGVFQNQNDAKMFFELVKSLIN
ncbi:MAG: DHHA1 domain-containing protein [Vallitalea sp.]|jgi:alanyl-tRNA synthetase|nr:DHHA1 domain-containing protein [Vallitalea sp.]